MMFMTKMTYLRQYVSKYSRVSTTYKWWILLSDTVQLKRKRTYKGWIRISDSAYWHVRGTTAPQCNACWAVVCSRERFTPSRHRTQLESFRAVVYNLAYMFYTCTLRNTKQSTSDQLMKRTVVQELITHLCTLRLKRTNDVTNDVTTHWRHLRLFEALCLEDGQSEERLTANTTTTHRHVTCLL